MGITTNFANVKRTIKTTDDSTGVPTACMQVTLGMEGEAIKERKRSSW